MNVAAVGAVHYLLTEETLVWRGGRTNEKRGGSASVGLFWPTSGPSSSCMLLSSIRSPAPLHVGFGRYYPRDQDKGSCHMNSGLLSWSSGISCHCILVLAIYGSKFFLYLHTNRATWSSCIASSELNANLSIKRVIFYVNNTSKSICTSELVTLLVCLVAG
jgi:hypothetical protein